MDILKPVHRIPLEREYEGWIVNEIEKYFDNINLQVEIFAISPDLEKYIPIDEAIGFQHKFIGLQFKKADLSLLRKNQRIEDYSNIKWELRIPYGQFNNILKKPYVYYCLPTFINRQYKLNSLHHCLFWRPNDQDHPGSYWYKNNKEKRDNAGVNQKADRWGTFIERVFNCDIGLKSSPDTPIIEHIEKLVEIEKYKIEKNIYNGLYAMIIQIKK